MKIREIAFFEAKNENQIYLHKEGLFWKAYEKSAFLFVQGVKKYDVRARYYKVVKSSLVSLGFPDSVLEEVLQGQKILRQDTGMVVLAMEALTNHEDEYSKWKKHIVKEQESMQDIIGGASIGNEIVQKVQIFPLANSTPMDCLLFVSQLKALVSGKQQVK